MATIETPLGQMQILFDGKPTQYMVVNLPNDSLCPDVDKRMKIVVDYAKDFSNHSIQCVMCNPQSNVKRGFESGERLEALAFYFENVKLTIAAEGDSYYIDGKRCSDSGYDYDVSYLENGMQYDVLSFTKSQPFVFGISWIAPYTEENDIQTWFAADPTTM